MVYSYYGEQGRTGVLIWFSKRIYPSSGAADGALSSLHVAKVPHKEKGYVYMLPNATHASEIVVSQNITDNITDIAFSGNMCVITTKPGYASAITVPIDNRAIPEVLGTIAGDNVILLILREGFDVESLMEQLYSLFPSIRHL